VIERAASSLPDTFEDDPGDLEWSNNSVGLSRVVAFEKVVAPLVEVGRRLFVRVGKGCRHVRIEVQAPKGGQGNHKGSTGHSTKEQELK
jgi:hypothetical protein